MDGINVSLTEGDQVMGLKERLLRDDCRHKYNVKFEGDIETFLGVVLN